MASADARPASAVTVTVAYSPAAGQVDTVALRLPSGATVADALHASGLLERHGLTAGPDLVLGVWGRRQPPDTPLREADRVEIYRGLQVDPKEARRLRYRGQRKPAAPQGRG